MQYAEILYQRRRQLGLSISQAAKVLRMRESVLEAFEDGDFDHLPALGYAQGMVASYARYLGLDSRQITELYEREHAEYVAGVTGRAPSGLASLRDEPRFHDPASATSPVRTSSMAPTALPSGRSDVGRDGYGRRGDRSQRAPYDYRDEVRDRSNRPSREDSYASRESDRGYRSYRDDAAADRRYTTRNPNGSSDRARRASQADRARRARAGEDTYGSWGDSSYRRERTRALPSADDTVTTRRVESDRYRDDLRFDGQARSYRPSSTRAGRQSSRNFSAPERPNVRRRQPSNSQRDPRARSRRQQPQPKGFVGFVQAFFSDQRRVVALIGLLLVILLVVIISTSVRSCASSKNSSEKVSVVTSVTAETTSAATTASTLEQQVLSDAAEKQAASSAAAATQETKVSVSVDDGATTWVEITCDGEQKVAESVTGSWSEEYTVTKSIEIRVGDPSVVTVQKNGEKQVFGSKSGGVSTLSIQGTDPNASSDEATTDSSDASDESDSDN